MNWRLLPGIFAIISFVALWLLFVIGRSRYRRRSAEHSRGSPPRVAVITPVTGSVPALGKFLSQLASQNYPEFRVYIVTRDHADPAVPIIKRSIEGRAHCFSVFAGSASACCQKNFNLSAGVRAAGDWPSVLAFCDTGHSVPPDWLSNLAAALDGEAVGSSTGYHLVHPQDRRIPTVGKAICVAALYLTQGLNRFRQVWGGANAIHTKTFRELEVDRIWGEAVVDDVSLTRLLKRSGLRIALAPGAVLLRPEKKLRWRTWSAWLVRQWIFLKFWFPFEWMLLGLLGHCLIFCLCFCAVQLPATLLRGVATPEMVLSAIALGSHLLLTETIRRFFHPDIPFLRWIAATAAALGMAGWCHIQTLFRMKVKWAGIEYHVSGDGRVKEVRRL